MREHVCCYFSTPFALTYNEAKTCSHNSLIHIESVTTNNADSSLRILFHSILDSDILLLAGDASFDLVSHGQW